MQRLTTTGYARVTLLAGKADDDELSAVKDIRSGRSLLRSACSVMRLIAGRG